MVNPSRAVSGELQELKGPLLCTLSVLLHSGSTVIICGICVSEKTRRKTM